MPKSSDTLPASTQAPAGALDRPGAHPAWWLAGYAALLAAAAALAGVTLGQAGLDLRHLWHQPAEAFTHLDAVAKLAIMAMYLSMATSFTPLPTGWLIAAVAAPATAVAGGLWPTVALVAMVGAAASTVANLNEYHLLAWLMRWRRAGNLRASRGYQWALRWFDRNPFFLLVLFNLLPLPIDAVRLLAATRGYPRWPFALANFLGRLGRYGVIAFVTFYWNLGWLAAVALLALSVVLAMGKAVQWALGRRRNQLAGSSV